MSPGDISGQLYRGVAEIANRCVLANVEFEVTTSRGKYKGSLYGRRPNDLVVNEAA